MAQTYRVKVLDQEEWKELVSSTRRYEHVDETNLGFADPPNRVAYAHRDRLKQLPGLKEYVLAHEFEHLLSDEKLHEDEHGVRHKKFFKEVLAPIALPLLGGALLGPVGGALGGTLGGVAGAGLGAAAGGAGAAAIRGGNVGRSALTSGLLGAGTQALAPGIGKAFSRFGASTPQAAAQATQTTAPGLGQTVVSKLLPDGGPVSVGASGYNPSAAAGITKGLSGFGRGSMAPVQGGTRFSVLGSGEGGEGGSPFARQIGPAVSQTAQQGAGQGTSRNIMNTLSQFGIGKNVLGPLAIGGGVSALGNMFGKPPQIPNLGQTPSMQQFRTDVSSRLGPLSNRLQGLSNTPLPSELESPIRRQFQKQRQQLYSQFAAFRPGADLATDSEFRQAVEDLNQREAESIAQAQFGFQGNERDNIIAQLGVNESELSALGQLAGLDVYSIMQQTGLDVEQANQIKELFGNFGSTIANVGVNNTFANALNQFKVP